MTTTLAQDRAAGSRMHMLDCLEGGLFISDLNSMLRPTNFFVPQSGNRMPAGWHETTEAKLGKECESLIDDGLNIKVAKLVAGQCHRGQRPQLGLSL